MKEKKEFMDITEEHPRTDLKNYKKILKAVSKMEYHKMDKTKTNISDFVNLDRKDVERTVRYLTKFNYLKIMGKTLSGKRILFLSREGDEKTYWGREEISTIITESWEHLLTEIRKKEIKESLGVDFIKEIEEMGDEDEMLTLYQKVVNILDEKEVKHRLLRIQLNTKAYRFAITTKGETAIAKGA